MQEERVPENENLRAAEARLTEENARRAQQRLKTQRFAASLDAGSSAAGAVALGLIAGVLAIFAYSAASPLLWVVVGVLAVACGGDAWWLWRTGSRGSR